MVFREYKDQGCRLGDAFKFHVEYESMQSSLKRFGIATFALYWIGLKMNNIHRWSQRTVYIVSTGLALEEDRGLIDKK